MIGPSLNAYSNTLVRTSLTPELNLDSNSVSITLILNSSLSSIQVGFELTSYETGLPQVYIASSVTLRTLYRINFK